MDPTLALEDLLAAMDGVVDSFLAEQRLNHPPVDWVEVALGLPGLVHESRENASPMARKREAKRGRMILTEGNGEEKNQWIAAQTLTHSLLPRVVTRLGGAEGDKVPAAWSKLMVGRLMVPPGWFRSLWREHQGDFRILQKAFGETPLEFLVQAMSQVGSEPSVSTLVDHGVVAHRFSNGPRLSRQLLPMENEVLTYVSTYSRSRRQSGPGMTVWGWPVHTSDWKKEVLRVEFTEDGLPQHPRQKGGDRDDPSVD